MSNILTKDISNCPARVGFLPNDASGCHCYHISDSVVVVKANTPYNTTYYKESNCCSGYVKSREPLVFKKGFPTNQGGRWNWSTTNTKMYRGNGLVVPDRLPPYSNSIKATGFRQSGNVFPNTHKMSKKKLFAYLSRNRIFLNR